MFGGLIICNEIRSDSMLGLYEKPPNAANPPDESNKNSMLLFGRQVTSPFCVYVARRTFSTVFIASRTPRASLPGML
eukprot:3657461-Amphidinium_carterae.1